MEEDIMERGWRTWELRSSEGNRAPCEFVSGGRGGKTRTNQLQEKVLLHWVATRFTQAADHEVAPVAQHEGIAAQTAVVHELQAAFKFAPGVQTLCVQLTPPGPLHERLYIEPLQ
jgi:hypothetical protein